MSSPTYVISEIRKAVADYMYAEGCSCCRDNEAHEAAKRRLAKLLRVPAFKDSSGYDFYRFRTKQEARDAD
jgi:hypothetical protein